VVDDAGADYVHALHVAEAGVQVVEVGEQGAQGLAVGGVLEGGVGRARAGDVLGDLLDRLALLR